MQNRLTDYQTEVDNTGTVLRLLAGGSRQSQVARITGVSRQYVSKVARKAVKEGKLKRISSSPATYCSAEKSVNQYTMPSGHTNIVLPHRFGVRFMFKRKPKQLVGHWKTTKVNNWELRSSRRGDHTIVVYPSRVIFWIFNHQGRTVKEIIRRSVEQAREFALAFQNESGCQLVSPELLDHIEWTIHDKELSDYVSNTLKLDNEPRVIAGARFKLDDSHPDKVEIDKEKATEVAEDLEWILTDGIQAIKLTPTLLRAFDEQIKKIAQQQLDILAYLEQKG